MNDKHVKIIAEAGVNHNGSLDLALKLVEKSAEAGADFVKFQVFKAKELASKNVPKAEYQQQSSGSSESQCCMLQKFELSREAYKKILEHCSACRIKFLASAFDFASVDLLTKAFGLDLIKIGSGEITNGPMLLRIAQAGCDVILSTGMASLGEIEAALGVLAYGYLNIKNSVPSIEAFKDAYNTPEGHNLLKSKVTLLLCTTEYPAPFNEVNLRAMDSLKMAYDLQTGFSDHTSGIAIPIAAAARGALVIEKHLTLDYKLPGPDHKASLEPHEFRKMVKGIRQVEEALGVSRKILQDSEKNNISVIRKSLIASKPIKKGDIFNESNITMKRCGIGISPMYFWDLLGKSANRNYEEEEAIDYYG